MVNNFMVTGSGIHRMFGPAVHWLYPSTAAEKAPTTGSISILTSRASASIAVSRGVYGMIRFVGTLADVTESITNYTARGDSEPAPLFICGTSDCSACVTNASTSESTSRSLKRFTRSARQVKREEDESAAAAAAARPESLAETCTTTTSGDTSSDTSGDTSDTSASSYERPRKRKRASNDALNAFLQRLEQRDAARDEMMRAFLNQILTSVPTSVPTSAPPVTSGDTSARTVCVNTDLNVVHQMEPTATQSTAVLTQQVDTQDTSEHQCAKN